jgi:hypothetical protein
VARSRRKNVLRKSPKTISAFRADDLLDSLQTSNTITRGHAWAARRLRIDFERGTLLQKGSVDLSRGGGGGFQPGTGPAEYILMALERYQSAQKAMGKLFDIVFSVCIDGAPVKAVAARLGINPSAAAGRLYASLQRLQEFYESLNPKPEERSPATIGPQLGPTTAPMAAARWAAD